MFDTCRVLDVSHVSTCLKLDTCRPVLDVVYSTSEDLTDTNTRAAVPAENLCLYTCVHACMFMCVFVCISMHTHTHTQHTHTQHTQDRNGNDDDDVTKEEML